MLYIRRKRKWVFKPSKQRILLAAVLLIVSSIYNGRAEIFTECQHEYYGFPGKIYYEDCSGNWKISFAALGINAMLWYVTACLIRFVYDKIKFGV